MCAMLVSHGLNPQTVSITTLCTFVELGPYLGMVRQLVFDPEYATEGSATTESDTQPWWDQEVDDT